MNSTDILRYLKNPALLSADTLPELEEITGRYPWFQAGWALYLRNLRNLGLAQYDELLPMAACRISDRRWLKRFLEQNIPADASRRFLHGNTLQMAEYPLPEADASGERDQPDSGKLKLIDNFLTSGANFQNLARNEQNIRTVDLAERAVAESDDIVTETYVNLLITQKKYEKAISSLEKLSLKFPEKSIYFAGRVEDVKNLMNL